MKKQHIESILITSKYLSLCDGNTSQFEIAKRYLDNKIKILLNHKTSNSVSSLSVLKVIFADQ